MKKSLLLIGLAVLFQLNSQAQDMDLSAHLTIADGTVICPSKYLTPNDPPLGDSIHGIWGIINNGPDALLTNDQVTYRTSFHHFLTPEEAEEEEVPFEDRYAWYSIATLTENRVAGDPAIGYFSYDFLGDIGMLCDWEIWESQDSLVRYGPPHETFVDGEEYGFFVMTWGMGADANSIQNNDPDSVNNIAVARIIWDSDCATSIKDMLASKNKVALNLYPNPATTAINFSYDFSKNTHVDVRITDINGRIVLLKNYGFMTTGNHSFNIDISNLSPGNYQLEMNTGTAVGISKFSVVK